MRQVGILGGVLAAALLGTYATWFAEEDRAPREGVAILDLAPQSIEEIRWASPGALVILQPQSDQAGSWLTVEVTTYAADDPEDTDEDGPSAASRQIDEVQRFVGNDAARELWEGAAPLMAIRELGAPDPSELVDFGLDDPQTTLTIAHRRGSFVVQLGDESFGTRHRYALADSKLVLLDDKLLRPLQFARTRLVERSLQPWPEGDIATLTVQAPEHGERTFTHRHADDRARAHWVGDDREDPGAGAWIGKLLRQRLQSWVDPEEVPSNLTPAATITLRNHAGESWDVTFLRQTEGEGEPWWARSAWLRATVKLTPSQAEDLMADLGSLFTRRATDASAPDAEPELPRGGEDEPPQ